MDNQLYLEASRIENMNITFKCRDEFPPMLRALQYIYKTVELREQIFNLLEKEICSNKKNTGRPGMHLWHIFVLAVSKHTLSTNWDRLHYLANSDDYLRQVMGVPTTSFNKVEFQYQTIIDNVGLLNESLLEKINQIICNSGFQIKKKSDVLVLKTDSFVVETNVHFPTDIHLLYDSLKMCFDSIKKLHKSKLVLNWKIIKAKKVLLKKLFRSTSYAVFKGKDENRKKTLVMKYLDLSNWLKIKAIEIMQNITIKEYIAFEIIRAFKKLEESINYISKLSDQIKRRLIDGEMIPQAEKIYSIYEPHTEWISKGKQGNKKVELGHRVLVTSDENNFIVDAYVMENQTDSSQISLLLQRLKEKFPNKQIKSHSFDRGFYSQENFQTLKAYEIDQIILPKRGKLNKEEQIRESDKEFIRLKKKHSAIESNINMLEHHGLNRCMDKGIKKFKRYVQLSVIAYNLHQLGNILIAEENARKDKEKIKQLKKFNKIA